MRKSIEDDILKDIDNVFSFLIFSLKIGFGVFLGLVMFGILFLVVFQ